MPEQFEAYLARVGEQIRWKRALPVLTSELRTHLLEQRDAYVAEGMDEGAAEAEALRQMGDALAVGRELDSVHRPQPQWGLLCLVAALAAAGGFLRVAAGWNSPAKVWLFVCIGFACLAAGYFLDYSFFGRHAKAICAAVIAGNLIAVDWLSLLDSVFYPYRGGVNVYAYYTALLFPFAYALGVYALRGRRWAGLLGAVALAGAFVAADLCTPSSSDALTMGVCALATLLWAARRDWFGVPRKAAYMVPLGSAAAACAFILLRFGDSLARRWELMLYPEAEPFGAGFIGCLLRESLRTAAPWGVGEPLPLDTVLSRSLYLPALAAHRWGLIPFALLCAALAALAVLSVVRCARMKNALGALVTLAVLLPLLANIVSSIAANLGYILFVPDCPLLSGNLHTVIDMGLLGVMLSVFRQERLPEAGSPLAKRMERFRRVRWRDGELTISFRERRA